MVDTVKNHSNPTSRKDHWESYMQIASSIESLLARSYSFPERPTSNIEWMEYKGLVTLAQHGIALNGNLLAPGIPMEWVKAVKV